jgi:hypothetical protein
MIGHPSYSNNIIIGLRPAIHISSTRNKWIVCYAITIHLITSDYYFQKGFHSIGVMWIPNYKIENCVHWQ